MSAADPLERDFMVEIAAATAAGATVFHDPRLDAVAADLVRATRDTDLPSFDLLTFLMSHYGVVEPEPKMMFVRASPNADKQIFDDVKPRLPGAFAAGRRWHVGVGIDRTERQSIVIVLVQQGRLDLEPVSRKLTGGHVVHVRGRLLGDLHTAQVTITAPSGAVRELAASPPPGQREQGFDASFTCLAGKGRYQVEIGGTDVRGPVVAANFPVFCDEDPPRVAQFPVEAASALQVVHPGEAEREIFDLMNLDRAAAALPALLWDARLAEIARTHSEEMAGDDDIAHVSPRTGSAQDRARGAGLVPRLLLENVGRAYSPRQVEQGFMHSPGHRANIIDHAATHVGVGVALGKKDSHGPAPLFVTQLMAAW